MIRALLSVVLLTLASVANAWTTYQNDASHAGYVPVQLDTSLFRLRWQTALNTSLNPATMGDGKVFVSGLGYFSGQLMYTLDDKTGDVLWSRDFGAVFSVNPPAYFDGKVYVQTGNHSTDTYLRAFDASTGDLVFQSAHFAQWERYFAPTIYEGVAYVNGGSYGGMYAFNAQTGQQLWFAGLQQYDQWTPAVDANGVYAYVGGVLTAADKVTGATLFTIADPGFSWQGWSMNLAPALGGSNDLFVINSGRLVRFDLTARTLAYTLPGNFIGQPSIAQGQVYAISSNALTARDALTGDLQWSWIPDMQDTLRGEMIVTDTHIIVSGVNTVYAVSRLTRKAEWSYPAGGYLAISDGTLLITGPAGTVVAIELGPPPDVDGDGIPDIADNCPTIPNPDQRDTDKDGMGDVCNDSVDSDGDEWADSLDNCPNSANPDQANADGDAFGDVCDPYPGNADNLGACLAASAANTDLVKTLTAENLRLRIALERALRKDKDHHRHRRD